MVKNLVKKNCQVAVEHLKSCNKNFLDGTKIVETCSPCHRVHDVQEDVLDV